MEVTTVSGLVDQVAVWSRDGVAGAHPPGDPGQGPAGGVVVVDIADDPNAVLPAGVAGALAGFPAVVVGIGDGEERGPVPADSAAADRAPPSEVAIAPVAAAVDGVLGDEVMPGDVTAVPVAAAVDVVVADEAAAAQVVAAVEANPLAATALVLLLRTGASREIGAGLVAESATYSTLQAGPEHARWLAGHQRRSRPPETEPAVRLEREGDRLVLTLNRPRVRNAFDARTRDELIDGLAVAAADGSLTEVVLTGAGPAFCSGGDLDEFGTAADPASAHLLRLARSAGRAIATLADRVTAHVHGACVGAGIELPAFAGRVVAAPDATFRLPEVAMGLVPGAGGTVSLPRRIGRRRTAWLALTGRPVDATTALAWGLVDEVRPPAGATTTSPPAR